jgi:tetrapyrrole methylase family protein/MazG family protein
MTEFDQLVEIINVLRSPKGCPWDRAQELDDYTRYLIEEAYELIEGIHGRNSRVIKEEVGDIFLILVSIAHILDKKSKLGLPQILETVNKKLVSRHPHVFAGKKLKTKEEVLKHWIETKAKKKKRKTVKERLPSAAPALLLASIFFKETASLNKKTSRNKEKKIGAVVSKVMDKLQSRSLNKKDKEKLFSDIIFYVSKLAFLEGLDLENLLRKKVIKEAKRTAY